MPEQLLERRPIVRVLDQDDLDEAFSLAGYLWLIGKFVIAFSNFLVGHLDVLVFEGRLPVEKDEDYDSEGPNVDLKGVTVVHLAADDLRCEVVWGSAHRVPPLRLGRYLLRQAEVANFDLHFAINEQVSKLDVSMVSEITGIVSEDTFNRTMYVHPPHCLRCRARHG